MLAQEVEYITFYIDAAGTLSTAVRDLGVLNMNAMEDPSLYSEQDWMMGAALQTVFINSQAERFIEYPFENVPPRFVPSHTKFVEASVIFRDAMPLYRSSLDNRDTDLYVESAAMIQRAHETFIKGAMLLPQ